MFGNTSNLFGGRPSSPVPSSSLSGQNSLFGTPAASSSLFGTPAVPSPLFGTPAAPAAPSSSPGQLAASLFGNAPTSTNTTKPGPSDSASGGLFGAPSTATKQNGLFASAASNQSTGSSTGGMFGTTTRTPTTGMAGLFNSSTASQPFQSTGLFGASTGAPASSTENRGASGMVDSAASAPGQTAPQSAAQVPTTALFTALTPSVASTTSKDLFAKSAPLFGGTSSGGNGILTTEAAGQPSTTSGGLFKTKSMTTADGKPTGKLFGLDSTKPSVGLFGGASNTTDAVATTGLPSSLSNSAETSRPVPPSATNAGLFGTKPTEGSTAAALGKGLFGTLGGSAANSHTTPSSASGPKKDEGNSTSGKDDGRPFAASAPNSKPLSDADAVKDAFKQQPSSFLPVFGSSATETPKVVSRKPTTIPSVEMVKSSALEASQYLKVDDLMKNWEQRLKSQVYDFGRFSEAVMRLDLDLCKTVNVLENVQQQQTLIEVKQQELDMSLDQIENHQVSLTKMLQQMEMLLSSQLPADSVHPLQSAIQSLSANLDDSNCLLDDLTGDVNKIQASLFPGALGKIIDLVNIQQRSIERLSETCHQLKDRISSLQQMS